MNEQMGLAQGMGQGLQQAPSNITVEQVIKMLMDGADPEELVQQGIPVELVQAAMEQLMAMMEQQGQGPAMTQGGQEMAQGPSFV